MRCAATANEEADPGNVNGGENPQNEQTTSSEDVGSLDAEDDTVREDPVSANTDQGNPDLVNEHTPDEQVATAGLEQENLEPGDGSSLDDQSAIVDLDNLDPVQEKVEDSIDHSITWKSFEDDEVLLQAASCTTLLDALDVFLKQEQELANGQSLPTVLEVADAETLRFLNACLSTGNQNLALAVFNAVNGEVPCGRFTFNCSNVSGLCSTLVLALAAGLRISDAFRVLDSVKRGGVPSGEEVPFGKIVNCPCGKIALTVVQPQEGMKVVPCSGCRYEFGVLSGQVTEVRSENLRVEQSGFDALRKLVRSLTKQPNAEAVHSLVVTTPSGVATALRFATDTAQIPAQVGERVSVLLAAPNPSPNWERQASSEAPRTPSVVPGSEPGDAMQLTNHATSQTQTLFPPPKADTGPPLPFIIPALAIFAAGDAASSFIDPALPALIAGGALSVAGLGVSIDSVLMPKLRQISDSTAGRFAVRQELLKQHAVTQRKLDDLGELCEQDVRLVARLRQLQNKMEAVATSGLYSMRIERVNRAREGVEEQLVKRIELMAGFAKVAAMIEIEVELDVDVQVAEDAGTTESIANQIEGLLEVESLEREWANQSIANEEVEKLLQSEPPLPSEKSR